MLYAPHAPQANACHEVELWAAAVRFLDHRRDDRAVLRREDAIRVLLHRWQCDPPELLLHQVEAFLLLQAHVHDREHETVDKRIQLRRELRTTVSEMGDKMRVLVHHDAMAGRRCGIEPTAHHPDTHERIDAMGHGQHVRHAVPLQPGGDLE